MSIVFAFNGTLTSNMYIEISSGNFIGPFLTDDIWADLSV